MKIIWTSKFTYMLLLGAIFGLCPQDVTIAHITPMTGWFVDTTGRVPRAILSQLHQEAVHINGLGFQMAGIFLADTNRAGIDVAIEFGNKNGIGFKDKDNGIAIAVFLDKKSASGLAPSISVAVGRGLEGLLNDAKVGRFLDGTFVPRRKEGRWEQGLLDFTAKLHRYLKNPKADEFKSERSENPFRQAWIHVFLQILKFILFVALVIIFRFFNIPTNGPRTRGGGGFGGGGFGGGSGGGGGSFGGGGASR